MNILCEVIRPPRELCCKESPADTPVTKAIRNSLVREVLASLKGLVVALLCGLVLMAAVAVIELGSSCAHENNETLQQ